MRVRLSPAPLALLFLQEKMLTPKNTGWVVLSFVILAALPHQSSLPSSSPPPGFSLVTSAIGVGLFRTVDPGGTPFFVQVVDLAQGASVKLLHGNIADPGTGRGVYGGDNPAFARQTLQEAWSDLSSSNPNAFCLTNGQFYSAHEDRAELAFPLKKDGKIVSDGYGINEYPNRKLMLAIWVDRADIVPLSKHALYSSSAPDIIAGLSEYAAGRRPNKPTGRTFVGIADSDHNGKYEIILIFTSRVARKTEAANVLRRFGADKIIMLDGGGSTQLICRNISYVSSSRPIPQAIAVVSRDTPAVSGMVVSQWP